MDTKPGSGHGSQRLLDFMRRNVAILIASTILFVGLLSLAIGGLNLYLTRKAHIADKAYKELLLRPVIAMDIFTMDLSVHLVNTGLGPADIRQMYFMIDGEWYEPKREYELLNSVQGQLLQNVLTKPLGDAVDRFQNKFTWEVSIAPSVIPAGQKMALLAVHPGDTKALLEMLNDFPVDRRRQIRRNFYDEVEALSFAVDYCSISGQNCYYYMRGSDVRSCLPHQSVQMMP